MDSIGRPYTLAFTLFALTIVAGLACSVTRASAPIPGAELYRDCVNCHGPAGQGSVKFGAPRIAGMPEWYVALQLQRFQDGLRGKHPDDYDGMRMRAMSRQLMSADEIAAVAGYVSSLTPEATPATLTGASVTTGGSIFVRCTACHGAKGEGNQQVNAPPLAGLDDWYIERQLHKFQAGVRGKAQGDPIGPIMQAMALSLTLADIPDVAAYVHSLPRSSESR